MRLRSLLTCALSALALFSCGPATEVVPEVSERVEEVVPERPVFAELGPAEVRLSPDGSRLAFVDTADGESGLWLAPVGDLDAARSLAAAEEGTVHRFRWDYSGRYLVYELDPAGAGSRRIAVAEVVSGEVRMLTPDERRAELVHLSPLHPGTAVVALGEEQGPSDLYRLNLESGGLELIETNEGFTAWGLDDDLDLRLAFEPAGGGAIRVRQKAEVDDWADFSWVPAEDASRTRFLGFDAGATVAYFLDSRGRETAALVASGITTGEARVLFQDPGADVADVLMHPVDKTAQAVATARPRRRWRVLDEDVRADLEYLEGLAVGNLEIIDRSIDDASWLAAIVPFDAPRRFYLYDRAESAAKLLFEGRPDLVAAAPESAASDRPAGGS